MISTFEYPLQVTCPSQTNLLSVREENASDSLSELEMQLKSSEIREGKIAEYF